MNKEATLTFRNRIALIFDFDGTLAPSTYHHLLDQLGLDAQQLEADVIQPMVRDHNWEKSMARGFLLTQLAKESDQYQLTQTKMQEIGRDFPLYDGVPQMFERVRQAARAIVDDIEVEFYLLTAGFAEIPMACSIAAEFKQIWSGALHFGDDGKPLFVKRVVTYPEKPRYLLHLSKGIPIDGADPSSAFRPVPQDEWYIPIDQMIYVGDGGSDMPAFDLMEDHGGIAIGVFEADKADDWSGYDDVRGERRVQNLAPNDYREGSELLHSLILGVESIAKLVALRSRSKGE